MTHTKRTQSKLSRHLHTVLLLSSLTAIATGGCSTSDEARRASSLAGGCSINSDCEKDYICAFERCHIPCTEDRDCAAELRCVKSETTGIFVCQLEDETACKADKDCPGEQVCGVDDECRDACEEDDDCVGDQICASSNECASTLAAKDRLDEGGSIIPEGGGAGGSGGSGGSEATGGSGASSSVGGTGIGGVPAEPSAGDGSGGVDALAGQTGIGGDRSQAGATSSEGGGPQYDFPPAEYEELPGVAEPLANDTDADAVPITASANLYLAGDDLDWLSYTAPNDGRAHNITLHIDQESTLSGSLQVHAAANFAEIFASNLGTGVTRDFYLTLAPGAKALFRFGRYAIAGTRGMAFITLQDVPEADASEPNDSYGAAANVELGQVVSGQVLDPWLDGIIDLSQDWFAVELAQGTATFTFSALPTEGRVNVAYAPPGTVATTSLFSPPTGTLQAAQSLTVNTAGTYRFVVKPYNETAIVGSALNVKPTYFDQQYTFTITQ